MITTLTEKEIARVWRDGLLAPGAMVTEDGEPVEVIDAGWSNDDRGPDFRDAVLRLGRRLVRGDVEIHVRSSDWWQHGHHRDPRYNSVVLHAVMWHDSGAAAELRCGSLVPTLVLLKHASAPLNEWPVAGGLCAAGRVPGPPAEQTTGDWLDRAGEQRFLEKASRFESDLRRAEAGQCLYAGVMGALGYSRNKLPFLELARRVPLRSLEEAPTVGGEIMLRRVSALLGVSGLLGAPGQRECIENVLGAEACERVLELAGGTRGAPSEYRTPAVRMDQEDWHVLKVRPNNSPAVRLIALCVLLGRYGGPGWLGGLVALVAEAPEGREGSKHLEAGLVARCGGYTLLGRDRAADIAVNVLLPFAAAMGRQESHPWLREKALGIYAAYPRLACNSVEKQMTRRLGLARGAVGSAMRQQGLLHIYRAWCAGGCPAGASAEAQPGDDVQIKPVGLAGI